MVCVTRLIRISQRKLRSSGDDGTGCDVCETATVQRDKKPDLPVWYLGEFPKVFVSRAVTERGSVAVGSRKRR